MKISHLGIKSVVFCVVGAISSTTVYSQAEDRILKSGLVGIFPGQIWSEASLSLAREFPKLAIQCEEGHFNISLPNLFSCTFTNLPLAYAIGGRAFSTISVVVLRGKVAQVRLAFEDQGAAKVVRPILEHELHAAIPFAPQVDETKDPSRAIQYQRKVWTTRTEELTVDFAPGFWITYRQNSWTVSN